MQDISLMNFISFILVIGISTISAQLPLLGPCPHDVFTMRNFSFMQMTMETIVLIFVTFIAFSLDSATVILFLGVWHEQYRYFIRGEEGHTCVVISLENNGDGAIACSFWSYDECLNRDTVMKGVGKLGGRSRDEGNLLISFDYGPELPFWIIDTDYVSYAAVWGCNDHYSINSQYAWILTRDVCPGPEAVRKAMTAFRINGIVTRPLMRTLDNVCFPEDSDESDYDW